MLQGRRRVEYKAEREELAQVVRFGLKDGNNTICGIIIFFGCYFFRDTDDNKERKARKEKKAEWEPLRRLVDGMHVRSQMTGLRALTEHPWTSETGRFIKALPELKKVGSHGRKINGHFRRWLEVHNIPYTGGGFLWMRTKILPLKNERADSTSNKPVLDNEEKLNGTESWALAKAFAEAFLELHPAYNNKYAIKLHVSAVNPTALARFYRIRKQIQPRKPIIPQALGE